MADSGTVARAGAAGRRFAAVVLAGGSAKRLGGAAKPALEVAGRSMLDRVLAAVADADPRIVVGPPELAVPAGTLVTREVPSGGGPVAATAAGLALVPGDIDTVALLAADLPLLTADALASLRAALAHGAGVDAAAYVDGDGRRQMLCAIWRTPALRAAVDRLAAELSGAPVRALMAGVRVAEVSWTGTGPPPWYDCDTEADLRRVREWAG